MNYSKTETALFAALVNLTTEKGCAAGCLPIPDTMPPRFVVFGESCQLLELVHGIASPVVGAALGPHYGECPQCSGPHTLDHCPRWRAGLVRGASALIEAISHEESQAIVSDLTARLAQLKAMPIGEDTGLPLFRPAHRRGAQAAPPGELNPPAEPATPVPTDDGPGQADAAPEAKTHYERRRFERD